MGRGTLAFFNTCQEEHLFMFSCREHMSDQRWSCPEHMSDQRCSCREHVSDHIFSCRGHMSDQTCSCLEHVSNHFFSCRELGRKAFDDRLSFGRKRCVHTLFLRAAKHVFTHVFALFLGSKRHSGSGRYQFSSARWFRPDVVPLSPSKSAIRQFLPPGLVSQLNLPELTRISGGLNDGRLVVVIVDFSLMSRGAPVHGPSHMLVMLAAGFCDEGRGGDYLECQGLHPLCMLSGPSQQFSRSVFHAWLGRAVAYLCLRSLLAILVLSVWIFLSSGDGVFCHLRWRWTPH